MRAKETLSLLTVTLLVAGGAGYLVADTADAVPGVLTGHSPYPTPSPFPTLTAASPRAARTVGDQIDTGAALPYPASLAKLAKETFDVKGGAGLKATGIAVADLATGKELVQLRGTAAMTPASTTKLFTAVAAIAELGPDYRAKTQVVSGEADNQIVLVGGGDAMLSAGHGDPNAVNGRAGLADLAKATAVKVREQGHDSVVVYVDDSLFDAPRVASTWRDNYVPDGVVSPISPLEVNLAKVDPDHTTTREADPALAAAEAFSAQLDKLGIKVTKTQHGTAPAGAEELAAVSSAPMSELAAYMVQHSENTLAEVLGKLVAAHRGDDTSFKGAARAITQVAKTLGADTTGVALLDCSGLSRSSKVTARSLTSLLHAAYGKPEVRTMFAGLPVGGLTGTLARRFHGTGTDPALGTVRAKTGTLTGVHAMAGIVQDADGRALSFAVIVNEPRDATLTVGSESLIDSYVADIADCGCRP